MSDANYVEHKLSGFPRGVSLIVDVVFPGEYRIGFEYEGKRYVPGTGSYFSFGEALENCIDVFRGMFPNWRHGEGEGPQQRRQDDYERGLEWFLENSHSQRLKVRVTDIYEALGAIRKHLIYLASMIGVNDLEEDVDIVELRENGGHGFIPGKMTFVYLRHVMSVDIDGRPLVRLPDAVFRINKDLTIQSMGVGSMGFLLRIGEEAG